MKQYKGIIFGLGMACSLLATVNAQSTSVWRNRQLYVQANVGLARQVWHGFSPASSVGNFTNTDKSTFNFGLLVGMKLYKHIAAELGGDVLRHFDYTDSNKNETIGQSYFFADSKLRVKVNTNIYLYTRLGLAYHYLSNSSAIGTGSVIGPLMGLGIDYTLSPKLSIGLDYTHLPGQFTGTDANKVPNSDIFNMTLAYHFKS